MTHSCKNIPECHPQRIRKLGTDQLGPPYCAGPTVVVIDDSCGQQQVYFDEVLHAEGPIQEQEELESWLLLSYNLTPLYCSTLWQSRDSRPEKQFADDCE